jgi:hypothetical protein
MYSITDIELSSHEGTRCQFNGGKADIKLGIDVHQDFYVVVEQVGGTNPKPPSVSKSKRSCTGRRSLSKVESKCTRSMRREGFGFSLQRHLSAPRHT